MQKYDVIIIGGGIIGSSIAYELVKRRKKVLLLERNRLASEASGAAAGMLAAQVEMGLNVGPLFELALKSRALYPKLADELREISGIDIGFVNKGMLQVARTQSEKAEYEEILNVQQALGQQLEIREEGLFVPEDGQVDAPSLSLAYAKSAQILGADIREYADVQGFLFEEGRLVGVKTMTEDFYSEQVVVAAGAWSEVLLNQTGISIPSYPVKGECFSVIANKPLLETTLFSHGCYIVPKKGNRLLVGATATTGTFDKRVKYESIRSLMEKAKELLPAIEDTEWEKAWAGIRPQTKDGLPYLGLHPKYRNLAVATGHYRNGILLSAITGPLIADLLDGKEVGVDLAPFAIERNDKNEFNH